ncbi:lytic transglycosylase domain-containing protein [Paenibacillus sp. MER 99-2]|uniref:lytic transglycosylase domain-containing protein n=1 Tax=Paenibacillus sp. MER 99-2 TaxID=2939572 RepID=UPI00203B37BB|nr:lytic transglycosylase domain-containing protein [Paenibacillus sp. MER 99-2]MCM3171083.1 lytic transglycosylase domain-containing protein [Paenibacillus sp. MER 99-2]
MQIDPTGSRQLLELQLSNVANPSSGSAGAANSSVDFANMMDGLLGTGNRGSSSSDAASASLGLSKRSNDGLLWLQLGSQYSSDSGTPLTESSSSSPTVSLSSLLNAVSTNGEETVPTDYDSLIAAASAKYGVPESLIKAVIDTESNFNPNVVSSAGAKGLMQLMDGTAAGLGVSNSFDPAQNIDGGTKYLSLQLQRFGGEVKMALAAYNAGPGRVSRLGVSNDAELMNALKLLPTETQAYIAKVEKAQAKYTL